VSEGLLGTHDCQGLILGVAGRMLVLTEPNLGERSFLLGD